MIGWEYYNLWVDLQQQEENSMAISFDEDIFKAVRIEGNFTLNSGKKSNYFYDFERLPPNYMTVVSGLLHEKFKSNNIGFDFVVGPVYGGVIPGYIVADFHQANFVAYDPRSEELRGQVKDIRGRYIIIDDVISTYGTVDRVIQAIYKKNTASRCVGAGCFVFRGEKLRMNFAPTLYLHRGEIET